MKRWLAVLFLIPGVLCITIAGILEPEIVGDYFIKLSKEVFHNIGLEIVKK